jgi:hypothetical protein
MLLLVNGVTDMLTFVLSGLMTNELEEDLRLPTVPQADIALEHQMRSQGRRAKAGWLSLQEGC